MWIGIIERNPTNEKLIVTATEKLEALNTEKKQILSEKESATPLQSLAEAVHFCQNLPNIMPEDGLAKNSDLVDEIRKTLFTTFLGIVRDIEEARNAVKTRDVKKAEELAKQAEAETKVKQEAAKQAEVKTREEQQEAEERTKELAKREQKVTEELAKQAEAETKVKQEVAAREVELTEQARMETGAARAKKMKEIARAQYAKVGFFGRLFWRYKEEDNQ